MEAWKVILLVAALPLMGAAGLAYMNGQKLKDEIDARIRKEDQVAQAESRKAKLEAEKAKLEKDISEKRAEKDEKQASLDETNNKISQAKLDIDDLMADIKTADDEITRYTELRIALGEIEEIERKMENLRTSIATVTEDVTNVSNLRMVARAKRDETQSEIDARVTEDKNRKAAIITKDINSRVKAAYNDWGFVVIDAGDADGIVLNATLDIVRQGKPICKVLVTDLEPTQSSANIIRSSLMPGQSVQVGDSVIKAGAGTGTGAE